MFHKAEAAQLWKLQKINEAIHVSGIRVLIKANHSIDYKERFISSTVLRSVWDIHYKIRTCLITSSKNKRFYTCCSEMYLMTLPILQLLTETTWYSIVFSSSGYDTGFSTPGSQWIRPFNLWKLCFDESCCSITRCFLYFLQKISMIGRFLHHTRSSIYFIQRVFTATKKEHSVSISSVENPFSSKTHVI